MPSLWHFCYTNHHSKISPRRFIYELPKLEIHLNNIEDSVSASQEALHLGLCGLVVRVPGYRTVMYCASCEVQT
jgi:hypothetical protein